MYVSMIITAAGLSVSSFAEPQSITDPIRITYGANVSPIWLSADFDGKHERVLDADRLRLSMKQSASHGGLDTAIASANATPVQLSQVSDDLSVCFAYQVELTGEGRWWAGPKISVGWNTEENRETEGWYENYVVEIASIPPNEIEAGLIEHFNAQYLGTTQHDYDTYRHFGLSFEEWFQFWAIRQDYRPSGTTSLGPIIAKWEENGLPVKERFDGVKINIETYGPIEGTVAIEADLPSDYAEAKPNSCLID